MNARTVLTAALVLLMGVSATAASAQLTWEAGFKGGLGLGKLRGDTGFSESFSDGTNTVDITGDISDFRTGFAGGGFLTARINDSFGIRLEALFTQRGGTGPLDVAVNGSPAGTADVTFKLDYFEIPLLAVGSFPAGARSKFNLFGGPAVAFKTSANLRVEAQGVADEQDIGDTVESTDFGFTAGAGVSIAATERVSFVIDGRYTLGLSKIPNTGEDLKNNNLVFMAGISFPLTGSGY